MTGALVIATSSSGGWMVVIVVVIVVVVVMVVMVAVGCVCSGEIFEMAAALGRLRGKEAESVESHGW